MNYPNCVRRVAAAFLAAVVALGGAAVAAQESADAQAQAILKQAREALGGEAKLKGVNSLTYNGKAKRTMRMMMMGAGGGEGQQQAQPTVSENDFEVDILAPDKYVRRDTREVMNGQATVISHVGFNGEELIQRNEVIGELPMQPNFGRNPDPAAAVRRSKQDFLRTWMGFMLEPASAYGVSYKGLGAETVNGTSYDVVEATAPENFTVKIYFDTASKRPAMIRYRAAGAQPMRMSMGGGPAGGGAPSGTWQGQTPPAQGQGQGSQQQVFQRTSGPTPEADFQIAFSDYKLVDGIQLPHKITRSTNGEVNDETTIRRFRVNSNPKADKFKTKD